MLLTKEENEMYGGEYPKTSGDHHQDLYDWNETHNSESYYHQQLLDEEQYGLEYD